MQVKTITLIMSLILLSICGVAQNRNSLKGPEAKNYKPWKNESSSLTLKSKNNRVVLKGPAAKNNKVWNNNAETISIKALNRRRIFGPAAKNNKDYSYK
jgi:hypothetical protein